MHALNRKREMLSQKWIVCLKVVDNHKRREIHSQNNMTYTHVRTRGARNAYTLRGTSLPSTLATGNRDTTASVPLRWTSPPRVTSFLCIPSRLGRKYFPTKQPFSSYFKDDKGQFIPELNSHVYKFILFSLFINWTGARVLVKGGNSGRNITASMT